MSFIVYMTASTPEEARSIGKELVSQNLAACINIFSNVESIYKWEDEVQSAHEVVLIEQRDGMDMEMSRWCLKEPALLQGEGSFFAMGILL